jgi:membrane dipeptidase
VDRLERLYADGVRSLQLVHYAQNELSDLQTEDPVYGGLSQVGREVVQEMNRLSMVIDVAHASFTTARDVAEVSDAPIILSHSALKHGAKQHPRLLGPDHAEIIPATGGVIGMWPLDYGSDTFAEFVDNTLELVDLVGIDHVGLGTDMNGSYRPVFKSYLQLPDWTAALLTNGLSESDVRKLIGGNALRVLRQVL